MPPSNHDPVLVSKSELQQMLREAVQATPTGTRILSTDEITALIGGGVKQAFTQIGIDLSEPLEMQKDFAFIRGTRKAIRSTIKTARATAVGVVVTAVLTVLWLGLRAVLPLNINIDKK